MMLMIVAIAILAVIVNNSIENSRLKIKSDDDLINRWIVYEHRQYRKSINKPPIF